MNTVERMKVDSLKDQIETRDEALKIADKLVDILANIINKSDAKSQCVTIGLLIAEYQELRGYS